MDDERRGTEKELWGRFGHKVPERLITEAELPDLYRLEHVPEAPKGDIIEDSEGGRRRNKPTVYYDDGLREDEFLAASTKRMPVKYVYLPFSALGVANRFSKTRQTCRKRSRSAGLLERSGSPTSCSGIPTTARARQRWVRAAALTKTTSHPPRSGNEWVDRQNRSRASRLSSLLSMARRMRTDRSVFLLYPGCYIMDADRNLCLSIGETTQASAGDGPDARQAEEGFPRRIRGGRRRNTRGTWLSDVWHVPGVAFKETVSDVLCVLRLSIVLVPNSDFPQPCPDIVIQRPIAMKQIKRKINQGGCECRLALLLPVSLTYI
jgi:Snf2-ATP coupling, chromatin remodelling complex